MNLINELLSVREDYIKQIKSELLGPGSEYSIPDAEHEIISSSPEKRYSIGILFPQENTINSENNDSLKVEETVDIDIDDYVDNEVDGSNQTDKDNKDSDIDIEEDNLDEEIGLASQNLPSSMGITFFVDKNVKTLNCNLRFATYERVKVSDCKIPFYPSDPLNYTLPQEIEGKVKYDLSENCIKFTTPLTKKEIRNLYEKDIFSNDDEGLLNSLYKLAGQLSTGYMRIPHSIMIELDFTKEDYIDNNQDIDNTPAKITALKRKINDNVYSVTIMLVNSIISKPSGNNCLFQPVITVETSNNNFSFCEYANLFDGSNCDEEEQSLLLQYRNKKVYGTGLGTSLNWDINEEGKGFICSDFIPETEVPTVDFEIPEKYNVHKDIFSIKYFSDLNDINKNDKIDSLLRIVEAYKTWISNLEVIEEGLEKKYKEASCKNIQNCKHSYNRMVEGIQILLNDSKAWESFILANRAMFMQRVHLGIQEELSDKDRYPYDDVLCERLKNLNYYNDKDVYYWRPFQIAFLLMSIKSIVDEKSDDRDLVDLIWFPTGGGKTEAYLGLTAFAIFYRRMKFKDISSGTTVIMRYTLRLLASQQFTRASTLICACEYIRKESKSKESIYKRYDIGDDSITIGLWIGNKHTPNKNNDAKENLNNLQNPNKGDLRFRKDRYNKFQVLKCPWCGTKMVKDVINKREVGQWGYKMRNNAHFYMSCPQEDCCFNNVLPIQIVDEELYTNPPTLLFGTVDKFAMLPWNSKIGAFFASESSSRPPELIIQDELHLISGPLGTMVGLYETAIDAICSMKGIKYKVVASTATIRRAKEQCSSLYNREVAQFPSPGLDADDSFFSKESVIDYEKNKFGRKYIGLMPSGKTKAMMEVRAIAALLQKVNTFDIDDSLKDKLWTLTVYFNSLKDLGKCSTLIDDDVKDFIKRMAYRLGTAKDARNIGPADELTSRVSTTELNETLDKLEKLQYSKENIENKHYASNTLLATNMISVGIDVARLNSMLIVGQPKLTSEYIQASSRVGRKYPGTVFILYDGTKSRDRSHYEQFKSYHESFYRYVEPTGLTPFSKPARERALHAVVLAILRHIDKDLLDENYAGNFNKDKYKNGIDLIKNYIVSRDSEIIQRMESKINCNSEDIEKEIDNFLEDWSRLAELYGNNLYYGEKFMIKQPKDNERRVIKMYNTNRFDLSSKDTMTSMRNVDTMVGSNILVWED